MYSLRISFWIVPLSLFDLILFFSAVTIYMAKRIAAVEFMVIDVDT